MSFRGTDVMSTDGRSRMIATQLVARGIRSTRVLEAMLEVPRDRFVPAAKKSAAYADSPQPLACGQTISQPYIVARMLELLGVHPDDRALEVGTGTGYQAALLSRLACEVVTIERHAALADEARANFEHLGIRNCEVRTGDGSLGASDRAPFDVIIVAAAGPAIPRSLLEQLARGGRLIAPVGSREDQRLVRVTRPNNIGPDAIEQLDPVVFVPLIGAEGWSAGEAR